jgi:transposase
MTNSGDGGSMAPGSTSMMRSAHASACSPDEIRIPMPPLSTVKPRTSEAGGVRGYDGGKRISGRKRHLVVDTQGLILHVLVHPADVHDRRAAEAVLADLRSRYPELEYLFADMGYQGLASWLEQELGWTLLIVKRPRRWVRVPADQPAPVMPSGFAVLPQRWIVERTFAWLVRNRRLAKDWEGLPATTETWIYLAMSRLMTKRLAHAAA